MRVNPRYINSTRGTQQAVYPLHFVLSSKIVRCSFDVTGTDMEQKTSVFLLESSTEFSCEKINVEEVPLEEFMYLVFMRMPGESYRRRLRSLLSCLCDIFRALK